MVNQSDQRDPFTAGPGSSRNVIILQPKPTSDPNDPLVRYLDRKVVENAHVDPRYTELVVPSKIIALCYRIIFYHVGFCFVSSPLGVCLRMRVLF